MERTFLVPKVNESDLVSQSKWRSLKISPGNEE